MRRLHTSARLRDFTADCVRSHLPLGFMVHRTPLSMRQIDRYLRRTAPWEVEIILLTCADRLATRGKGSDVAIRRHLVLAREVMDAYFTLRDRGPVRAAPGGGRDRPGAGPRTRVRGWPRWSTPCARGRWWASSGLTPRPAGS